MKVINFFGGPGAGKSTAASGLFHGLKRCWVDAELAPEFAKEIFWSGSSHILSDQNYVFATQEHRLSRLRGQVDVAVTDAPLLQSAFYAPVDYPLSFKQLVFDMFDLYDNVNILVKRSHGYSGVGRLQDPEEADLLAAALEQFLVSNGVPFYAVTAHDASPQYLLSWLSRQGYVQIPEEFRDEINGVHVPAGWITPSDPVEFGSDGKPVVRTLETIGRSYYSDSIRTV